MHRNCHECTRLWSEYALATRHYLKLEGRMQIADTSRDERLAAELFPMVERANQERSELRRLIELHETEPEPQVGAATA